MADRIQVRKVAGLLALAVVGCAFESGSGQAPPLGNTQTGSPQSGSSGAESTTGEPDDSTSAVTSQGESDPTQDAVSSGDAAPSTSSSDGPGIPGDESSSSSGSAPVDCTIPITLTRSAGDATLFEPMQLGTFQGSEYAFSLSGGAGAVRFTFDVACPSTYRLFGRVRDDDPGTHTCCDPDSFTLEGPGNVQHTWFYGCDTATAGWTWAQVEAGEDAIDCDGTLGVMVPLSPGTHEFTLRNRESAEGSAHAGIAELVLTNDPTYTP